MLTAEHRSMGGKAVAVLRRAEKAELAKLRELFANLPIPKPAPQPAEQTEEYTKDRLTRTREQLDKLDAMVMQETDPVKLDRLVSATSRLEEQERRLSGRFTPGQLKPSPKSSSSRRPSFVEPTLSPNQAEPTDISQSKSREQGQG